MTPEERIEQIELLEDDLYMNSPLTKLTHEECRTLAEFLIDNYHMAEKGKNNGQ